jgi:hypothetical protein
VFQFRVLREQLVIQLVFAILTERLAIRTDEDGRVIAVAVVVSSIPATSRCSVDLPLDSRRKYWPLESAHQCSVLVEKMFSSIAYPSRKLGRAYELCPAAGGRSDQLRRTFTIGALSVT